MNKIINNNTLLSQNEIDTLIQFLTQHNKVQDTVLSQDSIDKLISLLQNKEEFSPSMFELSDFQHELLSHNATNLTGYSLHCTVDEATQFILITARNSDGTTIKITPSGFANNDNAEEDSEWGYCIEPVIFDRIAAEFNLTYSDEEYENVCITFATKRYGSMTAFIPALYLPTPEDLAKHLVSTN